MKLPVPFRTSLFQKEWRTVLGSMYGRVPTLIALVAAALLLAVAGPTLPVSVAAAALAVAGLGSGRMLVRRHADALAAGKRDSDAAIARVTGLCAQSAPVWIRQLETVRSHADAEVGELARVFGEIACKLDHVTGPSRLSQSGDGAQEQILDALASNGRELETLVAALRLLQTSKERIVGDIGEQAARLKDNAAEIRQIALHIRMVSLNATIEAARAGQAGKPFGVIVTDMRELAARTAEASELFSKHTDHLHGMVSAAFEEQEQTGSRMVSIAGAEALVHKVVASSEAMMRQLTQAIAAMAHERRDVREDISRALVALQFQDRVSQILSHVTRNLEEMQAHIQGGRWIGMDDGHWLGRLATDYSTHEEFNNHGTGRLSTAETGSAVTFF